MVPTSGGPAVRRWRRRLALGVIALLGGGLLCGITLPWWLGSALRWAGHARGFSFSRYERIGVTRFALHEVEYRHPAVRVTVTRLEADLPLVWWWRRGAIRLGSWQVDVPARRIPSSPPAVPLGWRRLQTILQRVATPLARWAPEIQTGSGVVRWPGTALTCAAAAWRQGVLTVWAGGYRELHLDATLAFRGDELRLALRYASGELVAVSRGDTVDATGRAWAQPVRLQARFGAHGWLPAAAELQVSDATVDAADLGLGAFAARVRGDGRLHWRDGKFVLALSLAGEPRTGEGGTPSTARVQGHGDLDTLTVDTLEVALPGASAHLTAAVTVERPGRFRPSEARLTVAADLAQLSWLGAIGAVTGEARLVSGDAAIPEVEFQLRGRDVAVAGGAVAQVAATGRVAWPQVRVTAGTIEGPAGERLRWRGGWDFATRSVLDAAMEGQVRPATFARWLPAAATVTCEEITLTAAANGTLPELRHSGQIRAARILAWHLNPVDADVVWAGHGASVDPLSVKLTSGALALVVVGHARGDGGQVRELSLSREGATLLRLNGAARLQWRPAWRVEGLQFSGAAGTLEVAAAWGAAGWFKVGATQLTSAWLQELGAWRGPPWQLQSLRATGAWERGPLTFSLAGQTEIEWRAGLKAVVRASAEGDAGGLRFTELSVLENSRAVVSVAGRLPWQITPGASPALTIDPAGAVALELSTAPDAEFWTQVAGLTGLELRQPEAVAQVSGTWAQPHGRVALRAGRVAWVSTPGMRAWLAIADLDLLLTGDRGEVRLDRLDLCLAGQKVHGQARWPLDPSRWSELRTSPWAALQRGATVQVEVNGADVAALAAFLPDFVAPKGRLEAAATYQDGAWSGTLRLRDGATRPLAFLSAWQDINADLALNGRSLEMRSVTALWGGQTVTLSGRVVWPQPSPARAAPSGGGGGLTLDALQLALVLRGENLPLVRQTGVMVRGDLDLQLTSGERGPPQLSGRVRLRESLFLSDLRALVPAGTRTKSRLPPYFAVEVAPFDRWRLNLQVAGERFLRVRTALFSGVASARFDLRGTLGAPVLRGDATVDTGVVKLPFATFVVQEGRVSLTPELGAEPQVSLIGTVRRLNHDLRLEVSGPASAPLLQFTSSPPLESGQVLLLVMTGESGAVGTGYTERQRMARLGTFLGQGMVASLGGESEAGDRLSVSTGENVSRQGRETYGIEYRLSERWSLVGEYDEFDEFNAGVKWRVYSRGGGREEPRR